MSGVNKVIIVGRVGNAPETRQFENGSSVTNISVATSESWIDKNSGNKQEKTEWHRIVFNGKLAEIAASYLRKGTQVYVEGKLRTREYSDNSGAKKYVTEIIGLTMQMLGGKEQQGGGDNYQPQQQQQSMDDFDDDVPF